MKKSNGRKSSEATKATKARKETPPAPVVSIVKPKAKAKGVKFNGDWRTIPSGRMLLALCIKSLESGEPLTLPTTREEARAMMGYDSEESSDTAAA